MQVRFLNDSGLTAFEAFIRERQSGAENSAPHHLLTDSEYSERADFEAHIELRDFQNRLDLAQYVDGTLGSEADRLGRHQGLWSWLALFYFGQLCPRGRSPSEAYKYVVREGDDWKTYYRHLIYGPWSIYRLHREQARLLLAGPVYIHPDLAEQFAARQELVTNSALMEVADLLYWDRETGRPKGGVTSRNRPGNIRRLVAVTQQLDLTYDLYGMDAASILALLPTEFERWLQ